MSSPSVTTCTRTATPPTTPTVTPRPGASRRSSRARGRFRATTTGATRRQRTTSMVTSATSAPPPPTPTARATTATTSPPATGTSSTSTANAKTFPAAAPRARPGALAQSRPRRQQQQERHRPLAQAALQLCRNEPHRLQPFVNDLYAAGADLVLVGHDHVYERIAPLDATGTPDPPTGSATSRSARAATATRASAPRSPAARPGGNTYGVLKLTLHPTSYDWTFLPVAGSTFTDSGTQAVHDAPPSTNNAPVAVADATARRRARRRSLPRRVCLATTPTPTAIR